MKVIGITGGVGSGKSRVLAYLEEQYSAVICQADHVAWELQKPGQVCYKSIVENFGNNILNDDSTINRGKLGQIVFGDVDKLEKLNQIMHPSVKEYITQLIHDEREKGTALFVLEAALLIEDHYDHICDELWYVYANETVRYERLQRDRHYSDEKIQAIMNSQLPEAVFREKCQKVIDNSYEFEKTCYQIDVAIKGDVI